MTALVMSYYQKTTQIQRKYNPDYIRFGFVNGGDKVEPRAQCVECALTLSNEALKPSKLKRHLETRPALAEKPVEYFKRKENGLQIRKKTILTLTLATQSKSALKASYLVGRVAQTKKAFTIAEEPGTSCGGYVPQDDWGRCCGKTLDSTTFKRHSKLPDFGDGLGHTEPGPGKDEG